MFAQVYIDSNTTAIDRVYDYLVPEALKDVIKTAMRVAVPFGRGNRLCGAFVVGLSDESGCDTDKLKYISHLIDTQPATTDYLIETAKFMRENYFCTYAEALRTVVPSAEKIIKTVCYCATDSAPEMNAEERAVYEAVKARERCALPYIVTKSGAEKDSVVRLLASLIKKEAVSVNYEFVMANKEQFDEYVGIAGSNPLDDYLMIIGSRAEKQREIISYLYAAQCPVKKDVLIKTLGATGAMLSNLEELGLTEITTKRKNYINEPAAARCEEFALTEDQKKVLAEYKENGGADKKFLLFGVTGSGKTHVFFEMFDEILKKGKQCLLLVPEIALTPQMTTLVKNRFPETVAIMHSRLTPAQRYSEYLKIQRGEARIVLGARSALFMPFKELGIIVVDEEHENSYKSSQSPRYNAVEVANKISDLTGCDLVLASATPSAETYYRAMIGEYRLLTLPKRVNDIPMPVITIADMREELRNGNRTPVSRLLAESIKEKLEKHEQVLLFLNRRGYNTYVFCRNCGTIEMCPHCEVSLTYHKNSDSLVCHYCGYSKKISATCPSCGSDKMKFMGTGTEKIQKSVQEMFPEARVLRLDSDVASQRGSCEKILETFGRGDADILIGTQMIVKGLDFDNVTLVGILLADASLNFPDINAAARTFQLSSQAAGRAGRRGKQGHVVMQTYTPENETLVYCATYDYEGFYAYDIAHRRKMDYPPFSEIIGVFVANEDIAVCMKDCEYIYKRLNDIANANNYGKIKTYAPTPAFIQKLKNKYIYHTLVRYEADSGFKADFRKEFNQIKQHAASNVFVEINPITLL